MKENNILEVATKLADRFDSTRKTTNQSEIEWASRARARLKQRLAGNNFLQLSPHDAEVYERLIACRLGKFKH